MIGTMAHPVLALARISPTKSKTSPYRVCFMLVHHGPVTGHWAPHLHKNNAATATRPISLSNVSIHTPHFFATNSLEIGLILIIFFSSQKKSPRQEGHCVHLCASGSVFPVLEFGTLFFMIRDNYLICNCH